MFVWSQRQSRLILLDRFLKAPVLVQAGSKVQMADGVTGLDPNRILKMHERFVGITLAGGVVVIHEERSSDVVFGHVIVRRDIQGVGPEIKTAVPEADLPPGENSQHKYDRAPGDGAFSKPQFLPLGQFARSPNQHAKNSD